MPQKILYPNWNKLSFKQRILVKRWIDSFIRFQAASKEIRISFGTNESQNSESIDDLLINFQFDIVDSSITSEGIRLEEIIPPTLLGKEEDTCLALCNLKCLFSSDPDCIKKCKAEHCRT